jgi:hypothetical protein
VPYPDPFPTPHAGPVTSGLYPLPKHNVVVLGCMDLRVKDELAAFLERDNLSNRYDHLITAGAALGVMKHDTLPRKGTYTFGPQHKDCDEYCPPPAEPDADHVPCSAHCPPWKTAFFDHLDIALRLHHPHDVYVVEHRGCGAYSAFGEGDFPNELTDWDKERKAHLKWAKRLHDEILEWYALWYQACPNEAAKAMKLHPKVLGVHAFLMDLRGNVELLLSSPPVVSPDGEKPQATKVKKTGGGKS